jgi:hypothetical protein
MAIKKKITPKKKTTTTAKKAPGRDASGKFRKGRRKTGGRKAGVKNKYSNVRDMIKDQVTPFLEKLSDTIAAIADPKDRVDALAKIMPFFIPKYSSTNISADVYRPVTEEERLKQLDNEYKKKDLDLKKLTIIDNDADDTDSPKNDL